MAACNGTKNYVSAPIDLARPDSELTRDCDPPVPAPKPLHFLTQREVEALLATNTVALIVCRDRHSGLVKFIDRRDAAITKRTKP